ncbi:MAG TPA: hypothetical protein VGO53_16280 [Steroidobacteraceae bacterium]|jgi:hypothetical protein|nr:hypothetical protein [Steroidobacteraceae bacterium]
MTVCTHGREFMTAGGCLKCREQARATETSPSADIDLVLAFPRPTCKADLLPLVASVRTAATLAERERCAAFVDGWAHKAGRTTFQGNVYAELARRLRSGAET